MGTNVHTVEVPLGDGTEGAVKVQIREVAGRELSAAERKPARAGSQTQVCD